MFTFKIFYFLGHIRKKIIQNPLAQLPRLYNAHVTPSFASSVLHLISEANCILRKDFQHLHVLSFCFLSTFCASISLSNILISSRRLVLRGSKLRNSTRFDSLSLDKYLNCSTSHISSSDNFFSKISLAKACKPKLLPSTVISFHKSSKHLEAIVLSLIVASIFFCNRCFAFWRLEISVSGLISELLRVSISCSFKELSVINHHIFISWINDKPSCISI